MLCPRCDLQLNYGTKECPKCGLRFKYPNESQQAQATQSVNNQESLSKHTISKSQILNNVQQTQNIPRNHNYSKCNRSTASILCYILGVLGMHNFYLGYFVKGTVRLVLFLLFCGIFVSPQIMSLVETGMFRITYDYFGIMGLCSLGIVIISYILCIIEFVHLLLGNIDTDAKGLKLQ